MDYEPLVTASMFTGIRTDMLTAVSGIMGLLIIIVGVGMLIRVLSR